VAAERHKSAKGAADPEGEGTARPARASGWAELWDTLQAVVLAVVLALLIRHFVVETYKVDGQSMEPTLQNGERLLVNKFIYRFTPPRPGQIIVFRPPIPGERQDFVKRVIAVGGQTVSMQDGVVYVDGQPQPEPYLPPTWRDHYSMPPVTVPPGYVFVLGDHRAASEDSRYFPTKFVPLSSIRGEAVLVWWPPGEFHLLSG
jgi:signal peptidase I